MQMGSTSDGQNHTEATYLLIPTENWPQAGPSMGVTDTTVPAVTATVGVTALGAYLAAPAAAPPADVNVTELNKANSPAPIAPLNISDPGAVPSKIWDKRNTQDNSCSCSAGWVLFGVGFLFPICWVVAAFLPRCTKDRNDRWASVLSIVMCIICIVALINKTLW